MKNMIKSRLLVLFLNMCVIVTVSLRVPGSRDCARSHATLLTGLLLSQLVVISVEKNSDDGFLGKKNRRQSVFFSCVSHPVILIVPNLRPRLQAGKQSM